MAKENKIRIEEKLKNEGKLENGEQLIWTGKAKEGKALSAVYRSTYLMNMLISYGITGFAAVKCVLANLSAGDPVDFVMPFFMLAMGSILPLMNFSDAMKAHKLQYAATDKRLISLNGESFNSVPYSSIHEAVLKQDRDGNTSLLCGPTGVKLKENKWRDIATMNCTSVAEGKKCDRFVLYAVDDCEGLKNAVKERIPL